MTDAPIRYEIKTIKVRVPHPDDIDYTEINRRLRGDPPKQTCDTSNGGTF